MNNYAVTTMDLANSIRKAGSTAATFNVTLDELVGYTTAIIFLSPYIEIYK